VRCVCVCLFCFSRSSSTHAGGTYSCAKPTALYPQPFCALL
jgi:hypothetical protein